MEKRMNKINSDKDEEVTAKLRKTTSNDDKFVLAEDEEVVLCVEMDIKSPIETLKDLLQEKTEKDLSGYGVWLQNVQQLEPSTTLVDQCIQGEGLVQIYVQIFDGPKRINIADVVKPTEEVVNAMKNEQGIGLDSDIVEIIATIDSPNVDLPPRRRGNRTGNNGQIQLWQFLLDILTDKEHRNIIQWHGNQGEFKLVEPDRVAALWGMVKHNETMNYKKMSRSLRHYKQKSHVISKVSGKRFVYKFICDLKQLTGYSAEQLSGLVNGVPRQPRPRRHAESSTY